VFVGTEANARKITDADDNGEERGDEDCSRPISTCLAIPESINCARLCISGLSLEWRAELFKVVRLSRQHAA
jgi:hypothetical protein